MRNTSLFASLLCLVISAHAFSIGGNMGGTDPNGSPEKPYLIEDIEDFDEFAGNSAYWAAGVHTKLMTDIDLAGRTYNFAVIAPTMTHTYDCDSGFKGHFNGNYFVVSNLMIDGAKYLGFFSILCDGSSVDNLGIENINITGTDNIGGLCGISSGIDITNCYSTGTVTGNDRVGGLCGASGCVITDCSSIGEVTGNKLVGGLCGENFAFIIDCFSTGTVTGASEVGGMGGYNLGTISDCHSSGEVSGISSIGGLCGKNDHSGSIVNCYSTGVVGSSWNVGGLCGINQGSITGCHSTGDVTGKTQEDNHYSTVGGLCGSNGGSISDCYSTGRVIGLYEVGGLSGSNSGAITDCHSTGIVAGYECVGGLCGWNQNSVIENSYSTGDVTGYIDVGGLCGKNHDTITSCYSTGKTEGTTAVGGLCGSNGREISNCYSTSQVIGDDLIGGLCGARGVDNITNCYATGPLSGNSRIGGLIGGFTNYMMNCYWDIDISGTADGVGGEDPDPSGVEGITTAQMMTQSTFTGWDFSTPVWRMLRPGEDTPRLAWQEEFDGDIAGLYGADMVDFAYLAGYWGLTGCNSGTDCGRADIDGSGDVGVGDLAIVSRDWMK